MTAISSTEPDEGVRALPAGTPWTRAAALTGVLFVVLVVPGVLLSMGSPSDKATAPTIAHYYVTHKGRVGGAGLLVMLSVIVGVGFFVYLRSYFRRITGRDWLSTLFFTGAVLFAISGAVGAGINLALSDKPNTLPAQSLQLLNNLGQNLNWPLTCGGLGLVYIALGIIVVRTRILPAWVGWLSWLMALLSATFFLAFIPFIAVPLWVLPVSIRLAMSNPGVADA